MSSKKMTAQQKSLLLEWLEKPENRWVMWTSGREYPSHKISEKWDEIGQILNNCRFGTEKSPEKWRKTFVELRCHIKKKYRSYTAAKRAGARRPRELTDIERRYTNIFYLDPNCDEDSPHAPCVASPVEFQPKPEEIAWAVVDEEIFSEKSSSPDEKPANKKRKSPTPEPETLKIDSTPTSSRCSHPQREAELVTRSWAIKLNRMEPQQRLLAEKFINDIIFEGEMGNLHRNAVNFHLLES